MAIFNSYFKLPEGIFCPLCDARHNYVKGPWNQRATVCHSFPAHLDGRSRNISKTWENRRNTWLYGWIVTAT